MNTQEATAPTLRQLIERWENVERVLVNLPEHERTKHWRMSTYGRTNECGTVGCAAGHCGMDPWFNAQGMTLEPAPFDSFESPTFSGCIPYLFLRNFFGDSGCSAIFFDGNERSVDVVIGEVREHIKTLKAELPSEVA